MLLPPDEIPAEAALVVSIFVAEQIVVGDEHRRIPRAAGQLRKDHVAALKRSPAPKRELVATRPHLPPARQTRVGTHHGLIEDGRPPRERIEAGCPNPRIAVESNEVVA